MKAFYDYWKEKRNRQKGQPLAPSVRTEKKDGTTLHDPYVAFRRRIEKMQTRKVSLIFVPYFSKIQSF